MDKERHPKGLYVLFFTEMWERFGFYLLLGILELYLEDTLKGGMSWSGAQAAELIGTYLALVYFTPFIGGLLADRLFGCRKMIVAGGLLMSLGYFTMAIPGKGGLFLGLGLVILGNGAFKPNISTILGNLYPPGSRLRDAGYNIFYMGINIGAFICNLVAAIVRNYCDAHPLAISSTVVVRGWSAAFSTAGFGMLLGLAIFGLYYRRLGKADPDPGTGTQPKESLKPLLVQCLAPAITFAAAAYFAVDYARDPKTYNFKVISPINAGFLAGCLPVIAFYVSIWRGVKDPADRGRTGALLTVFGVVIVFWTIFHLNSTALTVWTRDNTDRVPGAVVRTVTDLGDEFTELAPPKYFKNAGPETPAPEEGKPLKLVNTELFQSINPAFVVLFTPLVVGFWHFLRLRGKEPSTPAKLGLGLLLTACAPLIMLAATAVTHDGATKGSAEWLFGVYAMITLGELCLSPMGLSLVNKMAPANIRAFMMGGWFLSTSFGNKLSGFFGELYQTTDHYVFWPVLAGSAAFFACVIFLLLPWLNRQMTERTA